MEAASNKIGESLSVYRRGPRATASPPCSDPPNKAFSKNIILPLDGLMEFLANTFVCKKCRTKQFNINEVTVGIATSLNFECKCGAVHSCKAVMRSTVNQYAEWGSSPLAQPGQIPASSFDLNVKLVQAMQLTGSGASSGATVCGMLDLACNPMRQTWTKVEEEIGIKEMELGKDILLSNLQEEINASNLPIWNGRPGISCQSDTRWDQRKSGFSYSSDSGASILIGNATKKIIAIHCMSKVCSK